MSQDETQAYPSRSGMHALILPQHFLRLGVILCEFLNDVRACVSVLLLDLLCDSQLVLGRYDTILAPIAQKLLYEQSDVSAGNGNVLDARADDVAFGLEREDKGMSANSKGGMKGKLDILQG